MQKTLFPLCISGVVLTSYGKRFLANELKTFTAQERGFPSRNSSVNVTKLAVFCLI